MWEGQALPHDTKFGNSRCEIVGRILFWYLIHGLRWSGLIKAEPDGLKYEIHEFAQHFDTMLYRYVFGKVFTKDAHE